MSSFLRGILKDATLSEIKGVWTLFWKGCEYIGLPDACSKKDAEQQIAEMLFVRGPHAPAASTAASCPAECPAQTSWPARADLQYFESDMRMARMYLDISRRSSADPDECRNRARAICSQLIHWVEANGGHRELEQRLGQLRWHLAAVQRCTGNVGGRADSTGTETPLSSTSDERSHD